MRFNVAENRSSCKLRRSRDWTRCSARGVGWTPQRAHSCHPEVASGRALRRSFFQSHSALQWKLSVSGSPARRAMRCRSSRLCGQPLPTALETSPFVDVCRFFGASADDLSVCNACNKKLHQGPSRQRGVVESSEMGRVGCCDKDGVKLHYEIPSRERKNNKGTFQLDLSNVPPSFSRL